MHILWRGCPESIAYSKRLQSLLEEDIKQEDLVLCIGGDGTFLDAVRRFGTGFQYMPINFGTRGYLMNRRQAPEVYADILNQKRYLDHPFHRLTDRSHTAFNEFAVVPSGDQASKLRVTVDGDPISDEPVIGSGVLVSTAPGSTGWNMACGGTARHPLSQDISVTFINAYSPRVPPFIVPATSTIQIDVCEQDKRPCVTKSDGVTMQEGVSTVTVSKTLQDPVVVLYAADHNFTRRMIGKVIR